MNKKDEQIAEDPNGVFINERFNTEEAFDDEDNENDFEGFDGVKDEDGIKKTEDDDSDDDDSDKGLDFDKDAAEEKADEKEEEESDDKLDLETFNKKLGTDFKTEEDLKAHFDKSDRSDPPVDIAKEIEKEQNAIDYYEPLVALSDEDLMRKQYESIAVQNGKDLKDEDVAYDIDNQIESLKDSMTLDLRADKLRQEIKTQVISPAKEKMLSLNEKSKEKFAAEEQEKNKSLQNAFADIYKNKNFFGVELTEKEIVDAYKGANEFVDLLKSDKKVLAEVSMMYKRRDDIYKKASGKTYGDGIKSILDEFSVKKEDSAISRAQQMGSSAGSEGGDGLIADLLK
jgi:hypothetical protein